MARRHPASLQTRQLEALVAVAQGGSVHAASRALGIPQPAVSRLVAATEKAVGAELFVRSRSGTHVTQTGERVVKQATFALRALASVTQAARETLPVVRLGCIPRVMHVLLPHVLARVGHGTAGFKLDVAVGTSNEMAREVEAAKLDFMIGHRPAPGATTVKLQAETLYRERTVVVCARDNATVPAAPCSMERLARLPWVLPKRGFHSRDLIDTIVAAAGLPPIEPVLESDSFESSLSVIAATQFVAIAPEFAARRYERLRLVRIVRTRPSLGSSPVLLQYRPGQQDQPAYEAFRTVAKAAALRVDAF